MFDPKMIYSWQIETIDNKIFNQYNENGSENTWKNLNISEIVRCSFVPSLPLFAQHDVIIDISKGELFIKRFGRGLIKQGEGGIKLREYLNCCVTNKYRFWVFGSNGKVIITHKDYELYP